MRTFRYSLLFFLGALTNQVWTQGYETDFIRYLNEDGVTYKDYTRVESIRKNSWHYIEKGRSPSQVFSFTSPREFKFQPLLDENYNRIQFEQGSFSLIREDSMRNELIFKDGIYTFQNDFERSKEGFYGVSAAVKEGFQSFNYVWVFPDNFEVINYECNRDGSWKLIDNTLSYTAQHVNNLLFKISYKSRETLPLYLKNRNVVLKDSIQVENRWITISIWDDSKIDNDVISIKLNDEWIVKYLEAKAEKITFKYLLMKPENFIILRADNIGRIPPNTTAVEIDDGKNSRVIVLNSDLGMSEAIKIDLNTQ
jgi:hypothetical protein